MNKKVKEITFYGLIFLAIFIAPKLFLNYVRSESGEVFYERLDEDAAACRARAERDSRDRVWCDEIRRSAKLAYAEGRMANDNNLLLMMFQPLLFVLVVSLYNLRKKVDGLKEKTDV